jgi:hypothetical protein
MRPRFRLRTLLAAVAVVGVICSVPPQLRARRAEFERRALEHGLEEHAWLDRAGGPVIYCKLAHVSERQIEADYARRGPRAWWAYRVAIHHRRLSEKYARLARSPWLPGEPDPPPPEL